MAEQVLIIGGGVIGCCCAYTLMQQGYQVTVLEKELIGNGGSSRNLGGVRQSARDPRELPLAMYSIQNIWPTLSEKLGVNIEYVQDGGFRLGETEEDRVLLEMYTQRSKKLGLEVSLIPGDAARKINPYLSDSITWASWCPSDGHANPYLTTLAYYRKARAMGARFVVGECVKRLAVQHGRIAYAETEAGNRYYADHVIVAAGYASRKILQSVAIDIPMKLRINECMVTEKQPPMFTQMIATAKGTFFTHQTAHGSFAVDATRDVDPWIDEGIETNHPTAMAAETMSAGMRRYFPMLQHAKVIRQWVGYWDVTPDGVPVVDKADEVPGLYIACGFSGHGFGIAPGVGEALCALVKGETPPMDISGLSYDRFDMRD